MLFKYSRVFIYSTILCSFSFFTSYFSDLNLGIVFRDMIVISTFIFQYLHSSRANYWWDPGPKRCEELRGQWEVIWYGCRAETVSSNLKSGQAGEDRAADRWWTLVEGHLLELEGYLGGEGFFLSDILEKIIDSGDRLALIIHLIIFKSNNIFYNCGLHIQKWNHLKNSTTTKLSANWISSHKTKQ